MLQFLHIYIAFNPPRINTSSVFSVHDHHCNKPSLLYFYLQEVLGLLRSLYVLSSADEAPVFLRYVQNESSSFATTVSVNYSRMIIDQPFIISNRPVNYSNSRVHGLAGMDSFHRNKHRSFAPKFPPFAATSGLKLSALSTPLAFQSLSLDRSPSTGSSTTRGAMCNRSALLGAALILHIQDLSLSS